jgi:hypothetical protein
MANRIREVFLRDRLDDPAEAEVWVSVVPEAVTPTTEVRGRLTGPRCHYATTVEVAYPLRPFARPPEGLPGLAMRVVIPEASLWEPESPFLYQGPVELWEEGRLCDRVQVSRGLRTLGLGARGLRLNGRPFTVRGVAREECSEESARLLRQRGCNTLLAPTGAPGLWDAADRLGFLVLGRLDGREEGLRQALAGHPSCLGWVLDLGTMSPDRLEQVASSLTRNQPGPLVGLELSREWERPLPGNIHFLLCGERLLTNPGELPGPVIVRLDETAAGEARLKELLASPRVLGWVLNS